MRFTGTMRVNEKGHLEIGGVDTVDLAREFGTPLYILDEEEFRKNCREYYQNFTQKHPGSMAIYAGKTLLTTAICRLVEEEGLGLDVVSGGELYTAIKADFPLHKVYFHGNNKSPEEIRLGVEAGVGRFVVDNLYELYLLNDIAKSYKVRQPILLRVSPGIEAHTHEYIKTGQIDSKFGFPIETGQAMDAAQRALELDGIELKGFHCHIGSQIFELESFAHTVEVMTAFMAEVFKATGFMTEELDLGGGLGIYYAEGDNPPTVAAMAETIFTTLESQCQKLGLKVPKVIVEPGRSIAGPAGSTLYTIGAIKDIPGIRTYVAVDGGMGDNPRPALYQAKYEAIVANKANDQPVKLVSIAGKCCESGDMLIWDIELAEIKPGDLLLVSNTGAYNYSMAMNYNRLPRPAMVLVGGGKAELIVRRETYDDLLSHDLIPAHLKTRKVVTMY
ncbi:diaminopimelate decarboxylase [Carboxydothermus ferrireducens]|uniref:Diaminopimelate decarboxylase n=1 Tax=Carboxydothermus ferrireducens DSM 11255 TaxID=1119529 RepID=A0ABX2RBY0_9THEO|nr:diaminopimelate decarboxylase [Carboxydothermus ferrireducens]NYE58664.1 diaminopimelate decarboxylase [Carboxydothermus ferrireducens DSM 11255]